MDAAINEHNSRGAGRKSKKEPTRQIRIYGSDIDFVKWLEEQGDKSAADLISDALQRAYPRSIDAYINIVPQLEAALTETNG